MKTRFKSVTLFMHIGEASKADNLLHCKRLDEAKLPILFASPFDRINGRAGCVGMLGTEIARQAVEKSMWCVGEAEVPIDRSRDLSPPIAVD